MVLQVMRPENDTKWTESIVKVGTHLSAPDIEGTMISGEVIRVFELHDSLWATIKTKDGKRTFKIL